MTITSTETAHSTLGASSAHRWLRCKASVKLLASLPPQPSSPAAREGSTAHALAEYCLRKGLYDAADAFDAVPGAVADMVPGVNTYLGAVYDVMQRFPDAELYVETRFALKVAPGMFGTCDAIIWVPSVRMLFVFDLKYGVGTPVDVTGDTFVIGDKTFAVPGNEQLMYYALGAVTAMPDFKPKSIRLVVVQPRGGGEPVKSLDVSRYDLYEFSNLLAAAIEADGGYNPGPRQCKWCAKAQCPKLASDAQAAAVDDFGKQASPGAMSPQELGDRLRLAERVEMWAKAVRELASNEAKAGRMPGGYHYVVGREGNRDWKVGVTEKHLKAAVGPAWALTETKLRSPTQLEKDIGKADFAEACASLIIRAPASPVLAPVDDKRPAWLGKAAEGF